MTLIFAVTYNTETKEIIGYVTPKSYFEKYHYLSDKFYGNFVSPNWVCLNPSRFKWNTSEKKLNHAAFAFYDLLKQGYSYSKELTEFLDKHKASMYDVTYKPRKSSNKFC